MIFFGSLFILILLLPHVSAGEYLTGNDNAWVSQSSSCPGWGEYTTMTTSSTIKSYTVGSNNQVLVDQWGWQDNGATSLSYEFDFYQFGQTATSSGSSVGVQILAQNGQVFFGGNNFASTGYYIGTAGTTAFSDLFTNSNGQAVEAYWTITTSSKQTVIDTYYAWPQSYNGYSLWNPIQNFQNDFVGPAGAMTYTDFVSGAGQFTYYGGTDVNSGCNAIWTAENSNMVYSSPSCGSSDCTQNFNAVSGYEGHSTLDNTNFQVKFGGGWGTTTTGVNKGDLLIATEAIYTGGCTYCFSISDSQGNTWTSDGGVGGPGYCSPNDCVEIWHAIAKSSGPDTVTFSDTNTGVYAYGFIREFVGYPGLVDASNYGSGTSGTPQVGVMYYLYSDALVIAVAADAGGGWQTGSGYIMIGGNWGWYAATEFAPAWNGATTAPWAAPSNGAWAELAVAYYPPGF